MCFMGVIIYCAHCKSNFAFLGGVFKFVIKTLHSQDTEIRKPEIVENSIKHIQCTYLHLKDMLLYEHKY